MPEKTRYPQIPSTVWWGIRAILARTPNVTIDERLLSVQLGVQETAARAYIGEIKAVGILNEEGKATPLAQKWRLDDTYKEAVQNLVAATYPEGLRHVAPPEEGDRQKIVAWFLREGLGQGAAGNKAATYLLIGSPTPNEAPSRSVGRGASEDGKKRSANSSRETPAVRKRESVVHDRGPSGAAARTRNAPENFPLNVNVQIHISADAGSEQIESIFAAMRRYLYDAPST